MAGSFSTMYSALNTTILLAILPLVTCSGEGNIRLLEDEVAAALKTCAESDTSTAQVRQKRFADNTPRIDNTPESNQYSHERRNGSDMRDQIFVINSTDLDYDGYGSGNAGDKLLNSVPKSAAGGNYSNVDTNGNNRTRRSEPLFNRPDNDQCLSQCVFANLQVVDSRGIPREAELWNKIQSSVTSQQSRAALKDQTSACFQELQSDASDRPLSRLVRVVSCDVAEDGDHARPKELRPRPGIKLSRAVLPEYLKVKAADFVLDSEAEDNGCSYSNKLERCLMLRFSDRKPGAAGEQSIVKDNKTRA